ncbi:hypothetical protein D3C80_1061540 [compost metagenome]
MLDERVIQAVRTGLFNVYAVRTVDEALSLLVGEPAGAADECGVFPEGSVNARVVERLREIAEIDSDDEDDEEEGADKADKAEATAAAVESDRPARKARRLRR